MSDSVENVEGKVEDAVLGGSVTKIPQYNLVGVLNPATVANTLTHTSVVNVRTYRKLKAVLALGNMANETVDFKCYKCDSDGSNASVIKSATQRAASATANDNKQVVMYLDATEVVGKNYVKFGVVTGGASGGPVCVVVLGEAFGREVAASPIAQVIA